MPIRQDNVAVDPGNTEAIAPIPERVAGHMNAYRGIDVHGVDTDTRFMDVPGYNGTEAVEVRYDAPEDEPEPIPVRVVTGHSRELRKAAFGTFSVNQRPVRIVGRREGRRSTTIKNDGPLDILISDQPSGGLVPVGSYRIASGASETLNTQDQVFAWAIDTSTTTGLSGSARGSVLVSTAAVTVVPTTGNAPWSARVKNESATDAVRLGVTSSQPTATTGYLLGPGESIDVTNMTSAVTAIRASTATADATVSFIRGGATTTNSTAVDETTQTSVKVIEDYSVEL